MRAATLQNSKRWAIFLAAMVLGGVLQASPTDLHLLSMVAPDRFQAGHTLTVLVRIDNSSARNSGIFWITTRLTRQGSTRQVSNTQQLPGIAGNRLETRETQLAIPADMIPRRYRLRVTITWGESIYQDIEISEAGGGRDVYADLRISDIDIPHGIMAGDPIHARIRVRNTGIADSPSFVIRGAIERITGFVSRETVPNSQSERLVDGVPAGGDELKELAMTIPAGIPSGEYLVGVEVNPDRRFTELTWSNTGLKSIQVGRRDEMVQAPPGLPRNTDKPSGRSRIPPRAGASPRIDFRCSPFSINPVTATAGAALHARLDITNTGNTESPGPYFRILLSASRDLAHPTVLYSGSVLQSMPPGFTSSWPDLVLTIPAGTAPGRYFVAVEIDPDNAIGEENERNNTSALVTLEVI